MIPAHKKDCEELLLKAEVEHQKNELESLKEFYENKISRQRLKMKKQNEIITNLNSELHDNNKQIQKLKSF